MQLNQVRSGKKNKKVKRVGRGAGSGHGKTSTRGHKGAGQRKGRAHYVGFEGGKVPYLRKIPKRGFNPKRKAIFQIVNLESIASKLKNKKEITLENLKQVNLIQDLNKPVKVLARLKGPLQLKSKIKAHKFSKSAKKIIEQSGGEAIYLSAEAHQKVGKAKI